MSLVNAFTEWDPLEEIIVGRVEGARIPQADTGLYHLEFDELERMEQIPSGPFSKQVLEETAEDLETLANELKKLGVVVRRPEPVDHSKVFRSPDWESDGFFSYCPRDSLLVVGNTILETPMVLRSRQYENVAYKPLLREYLLSGARWLSAPRPRLLDAQYRRREGFRIAIDESEPLFDAANVARCGRDLLYLVSDSGNHLGAKWLQSTLGSEYRVHPFDRLRNTIHIDTTLVIPRPGLVYVPAPYVTRDNLPEMMRSWNVVYVEDMHDDSRTATPLSSKWVGLNLLMVNPSLAIVDRKQRSLIKDLEKHRIEALPLELRHARALGGGFHCVTLDVRRRGSLQSYFD